MVETLLEIPFGIRKLWSAFKGTPLPGGVLPSYRLMGMCRCMGSDFHDWRLD